MENEEDLSGQADTSNSLVRVQKQLHSCGAGNVILQGPLLRRTDIVRRWEWRWFALDVSTGTFEYWSHRGDKSSKGVVKFDAYSTASVSPMNMMKEPRYDACCFYIITSQKEYFFCAETPKATEAWVATLSAAISVMRAHKAASSLLSGNARINLEKVATVVAAANVTARKATEDLHRSMKAAALSPSTSFEKLIPPAAFSPSASFKKLIPAASFSPSASFKKLIPAAALSPSASLEKCITTVDMDSSEMMRETLKVKDEELHQLVQDIKSRDLIIKELADRLIETTDAAELAASSVQVVDKSCREALSEVDHLRKQLLQAAEQIRNANAQRAAAVKVEEIALLEAHRSRLELGKVRERGVILEAAMVCVEEDIRRLKIAHESEIAERLKPPPIRMESTSQAEISLMNEVSQERNISKAADVSSNVEACRTDATELDAETPELEQAGSCEDVASGVKPESATLSRNASADLTESVSRIPELVPDGDRAAPSLSTTDHHEREVSSCAPQSNLPDMDDDKAAPSLLSTSATGDVSSKVIVMACDSEDLGFVSNGNDELEITEIDEVNTITTEDSELPPDLEPSKGIVVKPEQCKHEELLCFDLIIFLRSLQAYFRLPASRT